MQTPIPIVGVVIEPDPVVIGPSDWTYTLMVHDPDHGVIKVTDVTPASERWPPEVDVKSVAPGTPIEGRIMPGGIRWFFIHELPELGPCEPGDTIGGE